MSTPGSATPKCPCFRWTPTLNDKTPTPKSDILTPQTPGVAFGQYISPDEDIAIPPRATSIIPGFTPYFMRNFLNIGPLTPQTPQTPRTPRTPITPSDSKLYTKYYYWYWLLDPLFCNYGEEGGHENELLDSIRLQAMNIAHGILETSLGSYEDDVTEGIKTVSQINKEFIEEVFTQLKTEKPNIDNIIDQIKNSCQYRAATGTILPSDIFDDCDRQMNEDGYDGGSTRRRRPIKPSKKRSTVRRRRGRRSSKRKARTTRRRK